MMSGLNGCLRTRDMGREWGKEKEDVFMSAFLLPNAGGRQEPNSGRHGRLVYIFTSGDVSAAKNVRPVSMLPIASGILEYFVKQQLTTYLSDIGVFSKSQFDYRRQRSTEDPVVLAINRWLTATIERKYTGVVMVDMSKASDLAKHSRLITDLLSLGLSCFSLQWFCSYLAERFQQKKTGENLSSSTACSRGVPQGKSLYTYCSSISIKDTCRMFGSNFLSGLAARAAMEMFVL